MVFGTELIAVVPPPAPGLVGSYCIEDFYTEGNLNELIYLFLLLRL